MQHEREDLAQPEPAPQAQASQAADVDVEGEATSDLLEELQPLEGDEACSEHSWEVVSGRAASECGSPPDLAGITADVDVDVGPEAEATRDGSPAGSACDEGDDPEAVAARDVFSYSSTEETFVSDTETHLTDDLLRRGEPDPHSAPPSAVHPLPQGEEEDLPAAPLLLPPRGVANEAAARLAGAGRACASIAHRLCALAASVRAFVARRHPQAQEVASRVWAAFRDLAQTLQVTVATALPAGLSITVADLSTAVAGRARGAVARARKGAASPEVDWVRVTLTVGCGALAAMLLRSQGANARLAARLGQREGELAELLARIVTLQRNITTHRVPIIRHTACPVATIGPATWTTVVHAI